MIIGRDELEMNGADEHCSDFAQQQRAEGRTDSKLDSKDLTG